jgi:hypothetical protein
MYRNYIQLIFWSGFLFFSCLSCVERPDDATLVASQTEVFEGDEVTFTASVNGPYTCIIWGFSTFADIVRVDGGGENDLFWTVRFRTKGTFEAGISVRNCQGGNNPCGGTCKDIKRQVLVVVKEVD